MKLKLTVAGRAALVNAPNTGTNAVRVTHIGLTSTGFIPTEATTTLPGEFKRLSTFGGQSVGDDTIHVTIRDESADTYVLRGFALYLADGTLFAVFGQADAVMEKASASMLLLSADTQFADVDTTLIEFGSTEFLNPPATTEVQGVVELATNTEAEDGSDTQRAVTPRGLRAFIDRRFGANAPTTFTKNLLAAVTAAAFRTALEIKGAALKDTGHGNGLDADTLDGKHASEFALAGDFATVGHKHAIADVTGLQSSLDDKASLSRINDFRDQQYIGGNFPLVGFGALGTEQGFIGAWSNVGRWRVYSSDRAECSELQIKHNDAPRWNGGAMWHAGNFTPDSKMDKSGGTFTGGVTLKDVALRVSGWAGTANDGVVYFGAGNSYILKTGTSFAFSNAEGTFNAVLNAGGTIWTGNNFDPSTVVKKSGDTMTGQLNLYNQLLVGASATGSGLRVAYEPGYVYLDARGNLGVDTRDATMRVRAIQHEWYNHLNQRIAFMQQNGSLTLGSSIQATSLETKGPSSACNIYDRTDTNRYWSTYMMNGNLNWWNNTAGNLMYLDMAGRLTAVSFGSGSALALKEIEGPLPYGLAEVRKVRTLIGRYKPDFSCDQSRRIFFDADNFRDVMPEAVNPEMVEYDGGMHAGIMWEQVVPPLYNAVSQLADMVDELRAELAESRVSRA